MELLCYKTCVYKILLLNCTVLNYTEPCLNIVATLHCKMQTSSFPILTVVQYHEQEVVQLCRDVSARSSLLLCCSTGSRKWFGCV